MQGSSCQPQRLKRLAPDTNTHPIGTGKASFALRFLAWFISEKILLDNYEGTFDTIRDSGFGIRGSGFGIRDSGFGVRGSGFGVRDSGFGIRGSGFGIRGSGFGVRDSGFG